MGKSEAGITVYPVGRVAICARYPKAQHPPRTAVFTRAPHVLVFISFPPRTKCCSFLLHIRHYNILKSAPFLPSHIIITCLTVSTTHHSAVFVLQILLSASFLLGPNFLVVCHEQFLLISKSHIKYQREPLRGAMRCHRSSLGIYWMFRMHDTHKRMARFCLCFLSFIPLVRHYWSHSP